jgi:hypothetical protein
MLKATQQGETFNRTSIKTNKLIDQNAKFKPVNRQRSEDLNRENYLRLLQVAIHADSDKLWNMSVWCW